MYICIYLHLTTHQQVYTHVQNALLQWPQQTADVHHTQEVNAPN